MYERGWSDGLPLVPPTVERVARMLCGTSRKPDEVVAVVPPDLVECTVEKVAINAVMAGCRPEYLPVVLAAVEAACTDAFNIHGVLATTWFSGPLVIVNGPIARAIGMNSGVNALGQGNRANATIGRALQLVVRNVGGGRPGGVDRATLGTPGKYTFCFAEDEAGSPWEPLHVERGMPPSSSAVTLFAAEGVRGVVDQLSREPESLARSFAACLRTVAHPKNVIAWDAVLVVSPEHARVFRDAGWTKARLREELDGVLADPGRGARAGRGGHRRRDAGGVHGTPPSPSSAPVVCSSSTRVGRPGCSRPSSAAGPVARSAASRSPERSVLRGDRDVNRSLLDPTSELEPSTRERAPRPGSLEGTVVGLLDISKPRGNVFLDRIDELLQARGLRVERFAKPTFTKPAPVDLRHEIIAKCNVVIEALAD